MESPEKCERCIFSANEYLTRSNLDEGIPRGFRDAYHARQKVAVVGGGNVAMDAGKNSSSSWAEVHIVYRRSEEELPACPWKKCTMQSRKELYPICSPIPLEILEDENNCVCGTEMREDGAGEPDTSGRRRPVEIPGSEFVIDCDTVIMSLGTSPNLLTPPPKGWIPTSGNVSLPMKNSEKPPKRGVYAGGDAATGAATVIPGNGGRQGWR